MSVCFKKILVVLLIAIAVAPVLSNEANAADSTITLSPVRYQNYEGDNGMDVKLSYNEPIRCGEEVTFTVHASGGKNEFLYLIYALRDKDTSKQIQDFSYSGMQPSNEFKITFDYNCNVDLIIQVTEATKNGDHYNLGLYTRPVFTFSVADPSAMDEANVAKLSEQKADQVYAECKAQGCANQYDVALWLHDWIIDHCKYDNTYRHNSASDLFVFGTGTCEAYHAAYVDLLRRAGIECGRVSDRGHVWTLAKLDGEWCHIDTTGETASGNDYLLGAHSRRKLFGLNDEIITSKLVAENPENGIRAKDPNVAVNSLKNNYFIRSGEIRKYSDAYRDQVQAAIDRGEHAFSVAVNNSSWPVSYKIIINSLVAYQLSTESWYKQGKAVPLRGSYASDVLSFSTDAETYAMHRLYNPNSGEHFYTVSAFERDSLVNVGWRYEGIGWHAPVAGDDVYRLYNPNAGDHHYTTSAGERDMLVKVGWRYEGVGWKSGGATPLYRQYNPNATAGAHNFTTSKSENDWLAKMGWYPEGIAWYGVR